MRPVRAIALFALLAGCAHIPPTRYGVHSLRIRGMHAMGEDSLLDCLSLSARARAGITLAVAPAGRCGVPPFDEHPAHLRLWSWPWTEWTLFNRIAMTQDVRRVERWYAARGFHAARVIATRISPPQAERRDTLPRRDPRPDCDRVSAHEGCTVDVSITVEEGRPTRIAEVRLHGLGPLHPGLRAALRRALLLRRGERFDEALYDRTRTALLEVLGNAGFARARITGRARVDRPRRRARIDLTIDPGPRCVFGRVHVVGAGDLSQAPIRGATLVEQGDPFRDDDLADAQAAVYALGSFSAVRVEPILPAQGNIVDVRVTVTPAARTRLGLGVGVQSGVVQAGQGLEQTSVPQWDVHLFARYTDRDFAGGLRNLTIEERPRLIVQDTFPGLKVPRLGNVVTLELRQPGFLEPRTRAVFTAGHDFGPDPFDSFFRHRIDSGASLDRFFFHRQRLFLLAGIRNSLYILAGGAASTPNRGPPAVTDSVLTYFEEEARLDFRDVPDRPRRGFLVDLTVHEAGFGLPSSWSYLRLLPDARAYLPLPWHMTLAARFALGVMLITHADAGLDRLSSQLGPRDYRLRGGGASSNRGFLPGRLGDGEEGGLRRWEASLEARLPISESLGTVLFVDAGDVSRRPQFRLDHPQTSVGLGLRYFTLVGALRLDVAWRVPGLQVLGTDRREPGTTPTEVNFGLFSFPGAVHISLGEAF